MYFHCYYPDAHFFSIRQHLGVCSLIQLASENFHYHPISIKVLPTLILSTFQRVHFSPHHPQGVRILIQLKEERKSFKTFLLLTFLLFFHNFKTLVTNFPSLFFILLKFLGTNFPPLFFYNFKNFLLVTFLHFFITLRFSCYLFSSTFFYIILHNSCY